jgi:hypothetical protein
MVSVFLPITRTPKGLGATAEGLVGQGQPLRRHPAVVSSLNLRSRLGQLMPTVRPQIPRLILESHT